MQDAIERFGEHINSVGLKINVNKTKVMCFTCKRDKVPWLTLDGRLIEVVREFKYLGMVFDSPRLTWKKHVQHVKSKGQQGINIMKYVSATKWGADRNSMLNVNNALVLSRLCYGSPALISMSENQSNLQKLWHYKQKLI